jgi:hypothetical protein
MNNAISWFRYVPHDALIAHLAQGWEVADDLADVHHGRHASLCRWAREGEPPAEHDIEQPEARP